LEGDIAYDRVQPIENRKGRNHAQN
jgi:hypothetical protein